MTILVITLSISLAFALAYTALRWRNTLKKNKGLEQQLQRIQHQSKQSISNKANFLATASHDLQQPHQALGLFLASIDNSTLDPKNTRIINQAKDAHEATSRLLNQLLDISRLDTCEKPELETIPLHDFIHHIGLKFMPICSSHGIELRIRQRNAFASSDPVLLERILTNFLLNAIRHAKATSLLLSIRKRHTPEQDLWCIEVYDNGTGIAKDKQQHIFKEFTQLHRPDIPSKGLGLGLAIVQRLSSILQHPIELRSQLGKGSCFAIQLAASAQMPIPIPINISTDSVIRQRLKVAIIVHNTMIRDSLSQLVASWGCQYQAFPSSFQLLSYMRQHAWQPDALIIDGTLQSTCLNLSDIQSIRQQSKRDVAMIMITQALNNVYAKEMRRLGFALLSDPINPRLLKELLSDTPS